MALKLDHKIRYLQIAFNYDLSLVARILPTLPRNPRIVVEAGTPFIKREADKDGGGGDKRPLININVGVTDGKKPPPVRVIDGKTGEIES